MFVNNIPQPQKYYTGPNTRSNRMKIESADGQEGYLIWCGGDRYVFRIYDIYHNFVDYDLRHSDMRVKILDEDAFFYTDDKGDWIDHAPATLGIKP
jgi:hypothetical protein